MRKPGGRCPNCGTVVSEHVARARAREKRIEQVVAIFATVAVLALFLWAGGSGLLEGIAVYAAVGVAVWYWGKGTFWSETLGQIRDSPSDSADCADSVDGANGAKGPHRESGQPDDSDDSPRLPRS